MADYIPTRDADLVVYAASMSAKITLSPTTYGLTAAIATQFATTQGAFASAFATSQDPTTRSPVNVALKESAKSLLISAIRQISRTVQGAPAVSPAQKEALGLNPRDVEPSPIAPPATSPDIDVVSVTGRTVRVRLHGANNAGKRGKPQGVAGAAVFSFVGATPPAELTGWQFEGNATRTTLDVQFAPTVAAGATVWLIACWYSPRAQSGPFCPPKSTTLAGGSVTPLAA